MDRGTLLAMLGVPEEIAILYADEPVEMGHYVYNYTFEELLNYVTT